MDRTSSNFGASLENTSGVRPIIAPRFLRCIIVFCALVLTTTSVEGQFLQAGLLYDSSSVSISPVGRVLHAGSSIYGVSSGAYGSIFKVDSNGTASVLVDFNISNGLYPQAGLTKGPDGALYGTTSNGGTNGGWGTVFKITPEGEFSSLYSLAETNGYQPSAELLLGSDGNFYGTTLYGYGEHFYHGTVFRITPTGCFTTLVVLDRDHGAMPRAPLVEGKDGAFYGTTDLGGSYDLGAIFKVTAAGELSCLYSFSGTDGRHPNGGLLQTADGTFFGSTAEGGQWDCGTIFRFDGVGNVTTLVSFDGPTGYIPNTTLIEGKYGLLYGTTQLGGESNEGTVFRMTKDGVLTTLASFGGRNGTWPCGILENAPDGNLYGSTMTSTFYGAGSVFRLVDAPAITSIKRLNGTTALTWTTFPQGDYDVEYSTNLANNGWQSLTSHLIAEGNFCSTNDSSADDHRFYRIKLNFWQINAP